MTALADGLQLPDFNPRPREGGDLSINHIFLIVNNFNPRPREGGDDLRPDDAQGRQHFNPRPREGGDWML